jgi:hypothetical protein
MIIIENVGVLSDGSLINFFDNGEAILHGANRWRKFKVNTLINSNQ